MFINAFWLTNCAVCIKLINNANCKIVCRNFNIRHDNEMSGKGMRRPFTIRSTVKMQDTVSAECPHCGSVTDCAVICTKTSLSMCLVPVKKLHDRRCLICTSCGCRFYFDEDVI